VGDHIPTATTFAGVRLYHDGQVKFDVNVRDEPDSETDVVDEDPYSGDSFVTLYGSPDAPALLERHPLHGYAAGSGARVLNGFAPNEAGDVAYYHGVGVSDRRLMFKPLGGPALELARRGGQVAGTVHPDTAEPYKVTSGANALQSAPSVNDAGQVLLGTQTLSGGLGVWLWGPEGFQTLAADVSGAPAPGFDASVGLYNILEGTPGMNGAGLVAFAGHISPYKAVLWMGTSEAGMAPVLVEGDPAPGLDQEGVTVGGAITTAQLTDSEFFSVAVSLNGADTGRDVALLLGHTQDDWQVALTRGDPVPGSSEDTINPVSTTSLVTAINEHGQMLILTGVAGPDRDWLDDVLLFYDGQSDALHRVAASGDTMAVGEGDERVIDRIHITGGSTSTTFGRPGSLNDEGQFAMHLTFADGTSGVFLGDLNAIPEPGSLAMISAGLLGISRRRRKHRRWADTT
jgi:hypothetical protein